MFGFLIGLFISNRLLHTTPAKIRSKSSTCEELEGFKLKAEAIKSPLNRKGVVDFGWYGNPSLKSVEGEKASREVNRYTQTLHKQLSHFGIFPKLTGSIAIRIEFICHQGYRSSWVLTCESQVFCP